LIFVEQSSAAGRKRKADEITPEGTESDNPCEEKARLRAQLEQRLRSDGDFVGLVFAALYDDNGVLRPRNKKQKSGDHPTVATLESNKQDDNGGSEPAA
jgi:hypothetical protein